MHVVVRSRAEPESATRSVRAAVATAAPDSPVSDVQVLAARVDASTAGRRFSRNTFACFAAIALALALIGVYGVLALDVGRRTRDIGVRMALGASRSEIIGHVVARGLRVALPGVAVGLAAAAALARLIESQLFGVGSRDVLTYASVALFLTAAAALAAWLPARRAARVDPMVALRCE